MGDAVELGRALTGEELPLAAPEAGALVAELAALGWTADRVGELRRTRQARHQPWPFPVPLEARRDIGFARFDALLADARRLLGVDGLAAVAPSKPRSLDRDEQRLAADRPPHW